MFTAEQGMHLLPVILSVSSSCFVEGLCWNQDTVKFKQSPNVISLSFLSQTLLCASAMVNECGRQLTTRLRCLCCREVVRRCVGDGVFTEGRCLCSACSQLSRDFKINAHDLWLPMQTCMKGVYYCEVLPERALCRFILSVCAHWCQIRWADLKSNTIRPLDGINP